MYCKVYYSQQLQIIILQLDTIYHILFYICYIGVKLCPTLLLPTVLQSL